MTNNAHSNRGPRWGRRGLGWLLIALLPLALVAAVCWGVLRWGDPLPFPRKTIPREAFVAERCTWHCHNHGCRHAPQLSPWLAGDHGLFGQTVHGLHAIGRVLMPDRPNEGYGLANLLLFCLLWPGAMWGLYLLAAWQAIRLRERSRDLPNKTADLRRGER